MSQQHRHSKVLLECERCRRQYHQFVKNGMKTCGAFVDGATCGGVLKPVEKKQGPPK
jgi:hypothetical protein